VAGGFLRFLGLKNHLYDFAVVTENLITAENPGIAAIGEIIRFSA
jgi:hypothetical protein